MGLSQLEIRATDNGNLRYYIDSSDVKKLKNAEEILSKIDCMLKGRHNNSDKLLRLYKEKITMKDSIWSGIYAKYGLDNKKKYTVDVKTREIYLYRGKDK